MRLSMKSIRQMEQMLYEAAQALDTSASSKARPYDPALDPKVMTIEGLRARPKRERYRPVKIGEAVPTPITIPASVSAVIRDGEGLRLGRSTMLDPEEGPRGVDSAVRAQFEIDARRRAYDVVRGMVDAAKRLPGGSGFPAKTLTEGLALQDELRHDLSL